MEHMIRHKFWGHYEKNIALILIVSLILVMLSGCGKNQTETKADSKKEAASLVVEKYDYAPIYKQESVNNPFEKEWKCENEINPDFYMAVEDTITDYFDFSSMGQDYYYIAATQVIDDNFTLVAVSYDESSEPIVENIHVFNKNLSTMEISETIFKTEAIGSDYFVILKDRIINFTNHYSENNCIDDINVRTLKQDGTYTDYVNLYEAMENAKEAPVEAIDEPYTDPFSLAYDAIDNNYLVTDTRTGNTYFMDEEGKLKGVVNWKNLNLHFAECVMYSYEGEPVFAGFSLDSASYNVFVFDELKRKPMLETTIINPQKMSVDGHGKILFISSEGTIETLDTVSGVVVKNYFPDDAFLDDLKTLYRDSDGNIWLYYKDNRAVKLAPTIKVQESTINIQGLGYVPDSVQAEYRHYADTHFGVTFSEGPEYEDSQIEYAIGTVATQMAKGEGPDILCVSGEYFDLLQEKGCLMCLDGLISEDIRGQMYKGILESGKSNNQTYMLPYYVTVRSVMVNGSVLNKSTWTIDDLLSVIEKREKEGRPFKALGIDFTGTTINPVSLFIEDISNTKFVDYEKGKCSFDSKEFINILKVCQRYPETNGGLENTSVNKGDFAAGEILCMTTWRGFFGEYESMLSTYGENYYFIGYPTERGNGTFISADLGIAVNANTKNLDVVTDFIKDAYSFANVDSVDVILRKDSFLKHFETVPVTELGYSGSEKVEVYKDAYNSITVLEKKADGTTYKDDYVNLLDNALDYDIKADAIRAIILEETEPMLSGTKSPEETAKVIQSRVSLYLMERQ